MGLVDGVAKFAIKKNLGKWAKGAGTGIVAVASPYIAEKFGITLTPEQSLAISTAVASLILGGGNLLKHKFPSQFGWL